MNNGASPVKAYEVVPGCQVCEWLEGRIRWQRRSEVGKLAPRRDDPHALELEMHKHQHHGVYSAGAIWWTPRSKSLTAALEGSR